MSAYPWMECWGVWQGDSGDDGGEQIRHRSHRRQQDDEMTSWSRRGGKLVPSWWETHG